MLNDSSSHSRLSLSPSETVPSAAPSLPRISPRECHEITTRLSSILALLHQEDLQCLCETFHARASGVIPLSGTVGHVDLIETSLSQINQAIAYFRSERLHSKNPFLSLFLHHDIVSPIISIFVSYFNLLRECQQHPSFYSHITKAYPTVEDVEWFIRCFMSSMKFWVDPSLVPPSTVSLEPIIEHSILYATGRVQSLPVVHFPNDLTVSVNGDILSVLLVNIIKNAHRRGKADKIEVSSERVGDRVRLSISDNGVGVADELISTVFDLGVSGAGSTGIGLGAARERLAASGATIRCIPHGGLPSVHADVRFGAKFVIEMASGCDVR